jgi:septal ring factor EnvC (AmiA/AmiB activator)
MLLRTPHTRRWSFRIAAAVWLGLAGGPAMPDAQDRGAADYGQALRQQESTLEALRTEIRTLRKRDADLRQEERGTLEQLRIVEKEVALTEELLRELKRKQERVETQLEGMRAEHDAAKEELVERRGRLARTLRAMYMRGSANPLQVLLRTTDVDNMLVRVKYLSLLARNNERLLQEIRQRESGLAVATAGLTETLAEVNATSVETQNERANLEDSRAMRQSTLKAVRAKRSEYQRSLTELAQSEERLQSLLAELQRRYKEALESGSLEEFPDIGFDALRGRMSWPVRGTLTSRFGRHVHPKYGTETMSSGIDIAAPDGEAVRCVARGRVEYVQWLDGYGRTVIVNHGGGFYTVYAHLAETLVAETQEIAAGQVLGLVGDSGSLDGPKLHFEIRAGGSEPVDPMRWLLP